MQIRLKAIRRAKEVTQKELGEMSGIHWTTISEIERGARVNVSVETLVKLSRALGCTLDDLVG